ncbi:MAG TPA: peptidoglycan DD-metalloendopeptidase family protein [Hyphomonadaceae bacterium]|nr:peptidoglycan DD-metalloendopeptidase family protein [Hyphomonadaceae bacterium]
MSGVVAALIFAALANAQTKAPDTFSQDDLKRVEAQRDAALARLQTLEKAAASARRDASDIDNDLLAAAADSTRREEAANNAEEQLMILADDTETARKALGADQAALEDLLAALMTFGSRRPPALAASPEDAGTAVRAAILMSDAAPALAERAKQLKIKLDELTRLTAETTRQRDILSGETAALAARRDEIAALATEKRLSYTSIATETATLRAEADRLGNEADTLRDLLDGLAKAAPSGPSRKPETAPKKTLPGKPAASPKSSTAKPVAAGAAPSPGASGKPLPPAVGTRTHRFGELVNGLKQEGLTLATRQAAQVIAPVDARIQFSGPFRTYGRMLILDAGGDVLVIVAGLDALYPEAGQWVLAGEPIGRMADRKSPSPELYLEVRRSGQPVDPEKWLGPKP